MIRRPALRPWMLVSASWIGPAIFATLDRVAQTRLNHWDRPSAPELIFTGGDWFLYAFITPVVFVVSRRWPLTRPHLRRRVAFHLAFALLFCAAWAILGKLLQAILALIYIPGAWSHPIPWRDVIGWILTTLPYGVAVYIAMVCVEHAIRYFVEMREREVQVAKLSEQLADARLAALQAQLNPHFLFNALNTIAVHARDGDGVGTARIVEDLSDVLRRTLGSHRASEVPLDDEIELVRRYLGIERTRFPDRLRDDFNIEAGVGGTAVPGFALQHLVENAVRHGLAGHTTAGDVRISAQRTGDALVLSVSDNGVGFDPATPAPADHGIDNTRARLRTLYGDAGALVLARNDEGGITATLRIPYREAMTDLGNGE